MQVNILDQVPRQLTYAVVANGMTRVFKYVRTDLMEGYLDDKYRDDTKKEDTDS